MSDVSILLVDDNAADRYLLKRDLKKAGIHAHILEADDGDVALRLFTDPPDGKDTPFPPAVVFLDINMPRMSGLEFLEQFMPLRRDQPHLKGVTIFVMTSSEHPEDRGQSLSYGFVADFFLKGGVPEEELSKKVRAAMAGE